VHSQRVCSPSIGVVAIVFLAIAVAPQLSRAAACDEGLGKAVRITGTYLPTEKSYARPFVFALLMD